MNKNFCDSLSLSKGEREATFLSTPCVQVSLGIKLYRQLFLLIERNAFEFIVAQGQIHVLKTLGRCAFE